MENEGGEIVAAVIGEISATSYGVATTNETGARNGGMLLIITEENESL